MGCRGHGAEARGQPAEAKGQRVTVWYEEERDGVLMDVPYIGVAIAASAQNGLHVRFDHIIVDGNPEIMVCTNDDDWLYGVHHMKPRKSILDAAPEAQQKAA